MERQRTVVWQSKERMTNETDREQKLPSFVMKRRMQELERISGLTSEQAKEYLLKIS